MNVRVVYGDGTKIEMSRERLLIEIRKAGILMDAYRCDLIKKPKLSFVKEIVVLKRWKT